MVLRISHETPVNVTSKQVKQRWKYARMSSCVCKPFAVQVKMLAPYAIGRAAIDIQR